MLNHGIDPDVHGRQIRQLSRPLSAPTLAKAREEYRAKAVPVFPRYLILEPCAICNRRCGFCPITVTNRSGMMEWVHFEKLMRECGEHDVYGISLYQLGESFLWRDDAGRNIAHMVDAAKRVGGFKAVNLSTNGDLPNLACILGSELDDLIISIDGTTQATYAANRPLPNGKPSSLRRTEERVEAFLEAKVKSKLQAPWVRLQIINSGSTKSEVLPFIKRWIATPGVDDVFVKNLDSMRAWIPGLVTEEEDRLKADAVASMPCEHLWTIGSMTVDGTFNACAHDAKTELTDGSNIRTSTFEQFWNGGFMNGLRRDHMAGSFRLPCADCRERDCWVSA